MRYQQVVDAHLQLHQDVLKHIPESHNAIGGFVEGVSGEIANPKLECGVDSVKFTIQVNRSSYRLGYRENVEDLMRLTLVEKKSPRDTWDIFINPAEEEVREALAWLRERGAKCNPSDTIVKDLAKLMKKVGP